MQAIKAKTFSAHTSYAERDLNEWLSQRSKRFRIREMQQTQKDNYLYITILYTE